MRMICAMDRISCRMNPSLAITGFVESESPSLWMNHARGLDCIIATNDTTPVIDLKPRACFRFQILTVYIGSLKTLDSALTKASSVIVARYKDPMPQMSSTILPTIEQAITLRRALINRGWQSGACGHVEGENRSPWITARGCLLLPFLISTWNPNRISSQLRRLELATQVCLKQEQTLLFMFRIARII